MIELLFMLLSAQLEATEKIATEMPSPYARGCIDTLTAVLEVLRVAKELKDKKGGVL